MAVERSPRARRRRRRAGRPSDPLEARLSAALDRRGPLLADARLEALRLVHGAGDGLAGLFIDRYGPVLVVQMYEDRLGIPDQRLRHAIEGLLGRLGCVAAYRKIFPRDRSARRAALEALHTDPQPWVGEPVGPELIVREYELRFTVRPYDGYATGLFLDHRDRRRHVQALAQGRRVLNLFAYTCAYSVAAAAGGARCVISVDVSRKALEQGRRNFAANDLATDPHVFMRGDVRRYLERAARKGWRYDLIIADPPAFGRSKQSRRPFVLDETLEPLIATLAGRLEPGGHLLFCCNQQTIPLKRIEQAIREAARGRTLEILERGGPPADFLHDRQHSRHLLAQIT